MKRLACAIALALAAVAIGPAEAAPKNVVTTVGSRFTPQAVSIAEGDSLDYVNLDVAPHNVQSTDTNSDGTPLFASAIIRLGSPPVAVKGVETLPPGSYPFICYVHPAMKGTLTVAAA